MCSCLIDEVITQMTDQQILEFAYNDEDDNEDFMSTLLIANFSKLMSCIGNDIETTDNSILDGKDLQQSFRNTAIEACADEILTDGELDEIEISERQARNFCSCAVDKLLAQGYTYEQLMQADDVDGPVFNEVILACASELGNDFAMFNGETYNPEDIRGEGASSQITLIQYSSNGHKVKISICGVEKYFLFDTGASDMIINTEIEKQLIANGCLSEDNYLGETEYELADGTTAKGQIVVLNNVKIGSYVVDNVMVSIIEGGSLLCGHSLLNKFKKWELKGGSSLILYK